MLVFVYVRFWWDIVLQLLPVADRLALKVAGVACSLVANWLVGTDKKGGNPSFIRYTMILLFIILFAGYCFGVKIDLPLFKRA